MAHKGYTMVTSPRITARVTPDVQALLAKAAALMGVSSINSFVLSSAIEKAQSIMEREDSLKLSKQDNMLFLEALDKPTITNAKLSKAFKEYEKKIL